MSVRYCLTFLLVATLAISVVYCNSMLSEFVNIDNSSFVSINKACARECEILSEALKAKETWSLKVEDASGRKPVEFYWGNNYYLGSEVACQQLDEPIQILLTPNDNRVMNLSSLSVKSNIPVEYRMIYLSQRSRLQFDAGILNKSIMHIGLCLPKSCSDGDLEILSNQLIIRLFSGQDEIYGEVKFMSSKRLVLRPNFDGDIVVLSLM